MIASSGSDSEADEAAYFLPLVDPSFFVFGDVVLSFFLILAELPLPLF